jgi:hypothetical protein
MAFESNSQVTFFEGSYTEYEEDLHHRVGMGDAQPKRIRYKKLEEV